MPKSRASAARSEEEIPKKLPPARTRERRLQQLVIQAEELVEERIRKGTASPTEVTAVLRYGSQMETANLERVKAQTELLVAQREKALAETRHEELFERAMAALGRYSGEAR